MKNKNYSGGITCEQFLFHEIRIVARLLLQGLSQEEILDRVYSENLFQYPTERTIRRICKACLNRISAMESDSLTNVLASSSSFVAKQAALYALMKQNDIVYDFMVDIIAEKYRSQNFFITRRDLNIFLITMQENVESTARWSEATICKIKQVLLKILVECGYIDSTKSNILNPIYLYPEIEEELKYKGESEILSAFNYLM